jgi:plasmid stabilization system protein ParE
MKRFVLTKPAEGDLDQIKSYLTRKAGPTITRRVTKDIRNGFEPPRRPARRRSRTRGSHKPTGEILARLFLPGACLHSLMAEQRFNIAATVRHAKNEHVRVLNAINDDVLANRETPGTRAKVIIAGSARVGMTGKKEKPVSNGIDQAVGTILPLSLAT